MIASLRRLSDAPVHALCYSHGHIGYNAGVPAWLEHAAARGEPAPRLIAHRNLPRRQARYRETRALQHRMAEIQFNRSAGFFEHRLDMRVLYGGAALLDSIPNIGTPFRTLRDTVRWADTLQAMAALHPLKAVREFGPVIEGEQAVQQVLLHTARALRWLRAEVVRLMNEGLNEQQMLAAMAYPQELFGVEWMKPTYGDPSYIARDIYRSENGWWDRNPTTLHPAAPEAAGAAIADAITDKAGLVASARALADAGQWQLALHVIDVLATAAGDAPEIAQARHLKAAWLRERAREVDSYVSRNLYRVGADMIEQGTQARLGLR
jgi:uncharacterized sulfatase